MQKTQVVIIGGGATGAGILWDLTLRGVAAVLLEKRDLANGATGRCHGLLHSGARYAVKDPEAASECIRENQILKTTAPACVHDTGGLFVHLPHLSPNAGLEMLDVVLTEVWLQMSAADTHFGNHSHSKLAFRGTQQAW
jgi:glycerol-3-phosphate dehydrogenase